MLRVMLPTWIAHRIYREMIKVNYHPSPRLRFKLAETQEELTKAFTLLHDAYVSQGYMKPHRSGMRVTKYHALPSTSTLVALWDNEVVGTLSLVRDGSFGLPTDKIFDLSDLRSEGKRLVEVSGLAVDRRFSHNRGEILFPLLKFMNDYCMRCFGADALIISVNPAWIDFYEALLGFVRIKGKPVDHYDFVNGAPAIGGILDLHTAQSNFAKMFGRKAREKNLHDYFYATPEFECFDFPTRNLSKINDPVMTPDLMNYFFNIKTQTFEEFSEFEKHIIDQLYDSPDYRQYLPKIRVIEIAAGRRRNKRFDVKCPGRVLMSSLGLPPISMRVLSVSKDSFGAISDRGLRQNQVYDVQIAVGEFNIVSLQAIAVRKTDGNYYGFRIIKPPEEWKDFISNLNSDLIDPEHQSDRAA